MRIPDTFVFVDRKSRSARVSGDQIALVTGPSVSGARLILSASRRDALGTPDDPVYMQLHISAHTLKLVQCDANARGARRVTKGGYIAASELAEKLDLQEKGRHVCTAEFVRGNGGKPNEIWATFPADLRAHIERLNGARQ